MKRLPRRNHYELSDFIAAGAAPMSDTIILDTNVLPDISRGNTKAAESLAR